MLGSNVKDASDIGDLHKEFKKLDFNVNVNSNDYDYIEQLFRRIRDLNNIFKNDWKDYCRVSRDYYDQRWKITKKSINYYKNKFKIGTKILYYIGDKQVAQRKWRHKWTGPWHVKKHLNDSTCIITDKKSGNDKRVSFDRIKIFKERDVGYFKDYFDDDDVYQMYYNRQRELNYNTQVGFRNQKVNLDYNIPDILRSQNKDNKQDTQQDNQQNDN